jgi:hypothetical protein
MQTVEPKVARHRGVVANLRVGGRSPVRIVVVVPGHVDEAKDIGVIEKVLCENNTEVSHNADRIDDFLRLTLNTGAVSNSPA